MTEPRYPYASDPEPTKDSKKPTSWMGLVAFCCSLSGLILIPIELVFANYFYGSNLLAFALFVMGLGFILGFYARTDDTKNNCLAKAAMWLPPVGIDGYVVLLLVMSALAIQANVNSFGN